VAAGPIASLPRQHLFVARALGDDLAFELGERQQDVQRQPAQGCRGVELLRDGDKRRAMRVQNLHDFGEVADGATQPIHLVDHHAVDLPGLNICQQAAHGGTLHVGAGVPTVVVLVWQQSPSFASLAADVSLAGIALGVKRVEVLA